MTPTKEQQAVIDTNENCVVAALAGTGKTSLMKMYIQSRPAKCSVLYLAFNKSVKEEGERKFRDIEHCFVDVKTAHGLAYGAIVVPNKYKVGFLNPEDIMKSFKVSNYILAVHVIKYITLYCTVKEAEVEKVDYVGSLSNMKAIEFAEANFDEIIEYTKKGLRGMKQGTLPMIHDFYLKLYQLSKPKLDYDYILFDEGQDASETMLEIFLSQEKAIKVIVGDTHQQIYSWRGAVNSLEKVNYKQFSLSQSWRFPQHIADKAMNVVGWKSIIGSKPEKFNMIGSGSGKSEGKIKSKAVIGRTNLKLIDYVIKNVVQDKLYNKIYFEGGFANYSVSNVYMYVNDILALKMNQPKKVKNNKLKHLKNFEELQKFILETEDLTLGNAVTMVEAYGKHLPEYLEKIKEYEVKDKDEAQIIFSSVHRAKGQEYDELIMLDDFPDYDKLQNIMLKSKGKFKYLAKQSINEEINILYVALTRSKGLITMASNIRKDL